MRKEREKGGGCTQIIKSKTHAEVKDEKGKILFSFHDMKLLLDLPIKPNRASQ